MQVGIRRKGPMASNISRGYRPGGDEEVVANRRISIHLWGYIQGSFKFCWL